MTTGITRDISPRVRCGFRYGLRPRALGYTWFAAVSLFVLVVFIFPPTVLSAERSTPSSSAGPARSWFTATFRGGFWMPEDATFRRFYGRWSNDIYYLELGFYPLKNILAGGAVGGYYQPSNTRGVVTGEKSEEKLYLTMVPLEAVLGYRFRFRDEQLIVPFVTGAYDWVYFYENADPGRDVDGWKDGPAAWGGVLILLDKADPQAASNLRRNYGIEHTYLELSARYSFVGENHGLDLRGWTYTFGLTFDF